MRHEPEPCFQPGRTSLGRVTLPDQGSPNSCDFVIGTQQFSWCAALMSRHPEAVACLLKPKVQWTIRTASPVQHHGVLPEPGKPTAYDHPYRHRFRQQNWPEISSHLHKPFEQRSKFQVFGLKRVFSCWEIRTFPGSAFPGSEHDF